MKLTDALPILQQIAQGLSWQYSFSGDDWSDADSFDDPVETLSEQCEIRIKPFTFPPCPDERGWHHPDGWQHGDLPDGWRPVLIDENPFLQGYECKRPPDGDWLHCCSCPTCNNDGKPLPHVLYRTSLPLPVKDIPGPKDVPPGSVLHFNSWGPVEYEPCWVAVLQVVTNGGVLIGTEPPQWVPWIDLADRFTILRPDSKTFVPFK